MESNTATERVEPEIPMTKELAKNEQTIICAGDDDDTIENSRNPVTVSVVATESPKAKAKEETKNGDSIIGAVKSNGNMENSKNPVTIAAVVATDSPKAETNEKNKNEETILGAGDRNGDIENSKNPVFVADVVATESPKAKEEAKNEDAILDAGERNGNIENSKHPVILDAVVGTESPEPKDEAKNDDTILVAVENNGSIDNSKNPVLIALVATTAEVDSIISPVKTVESLPKELKPVKNDNKKKHNKEVQVSNSKKPFVYYLNRAKRYINEFNEVELCGLGMAIPTVVTIAEILKRNGFAIQKGIMTSTVLSTQEDRKGRQIEKAKIEIVLRKAEKLDVINRVVTPKKSADLDDAMVLNESNGTEIHLYSC